ncbi:hypothetical protein [Leeuwenhoekiella marinoflava]|uniref:hypothetical protein n=1 Tax=Leeuwenhoekiella marinoflava TaxID=988 RepID=UPI00300129BB
MAIYICTKHLFTKFSGCAVWPFIFLKTETLKNNKVFLNHEKIHLRQQLELLIVPFYSWYALEFCIHLIRLKSKDKAYRAISFEREAYANENNLSYLKQRSFWAFLRF